MLRFSYLGLALSVAFGLGCGATMSDGPSLGGSGSDGGGDSASTSTTASNGVPIPEPDPRDTCAALGFEFAPCDGPCAPLPCDCEGLQFGLVCYTVCITRVSCPVACALGSVRAFTRVASCISEGICRTAEDCKQPMSKCLIAPGDASGICATGGAGSDCFQDADCAALLYPPGMGNPTGVWSACVLDHDVRNCSTGLSGSPCNRHEQCRDKKCINRANSYEGTCTNGANDEICLVDADCKALLKCVAGRCTDGAPGSFCMTDADCHGNFCVRDLVNGGPAVCDTGKEGSKCIDASDCAVPVCLGDTCSSGAVGQTCWRDEHCVSGKCSDIEPFQGHCTDGKAGQECRFDGQQCEAGLRCARMDDQSVFVCTESDGGAPGDARVD